MCSVNKLLMLLKNISQDILAEEEQIILLLTFSHFSKSHMNFTVLSCEITRLLSGCCCVYKETLRLINRWDIRRSRTTFQDVYCICHCRGPMLLSGLPYRMIYLAEKLLCLLGLERSELCHLRLYVLEDVDAWTDCKAWHVDRQMKLS